MVCAFIASGVKIPYFADTSGALYSNPVQGPNFKDCHLIVALSSLAWINNEYFSDLDTYNLPYTFYFYDTEPVAKKYPDNTDTTETQTLTVKVNAKIFMDNLTGIWCGASSKRSELWPVIYEKAFAKFCQFKFTDTMPFEKLSDSSVEPDFSSLPKGSDWGGNPVTVLKYFTGVPSKAKSFTCIQYKNADGTLDSTTIYGLIKKLCFSIRLFGTKSTLGVYNGLKIQYPAGAWTYLDESSAKTKAGVSISYDKATLPADHCFSILGVYENAGTQYIVLRNPYGKADADSTKYAVGPGPWIYPDSKIAQICASTYSGTGLSPSSLDLKTADGIFALDVKLFCQYFEGFGYISW